LNLRLRNIGAHGPRDLRKKAEPVEDMAGVRRDELGGQEDPPLQRHHGPLHARLVGALPIQYPSAVS
jgi:hypothetical protein